MHVKGFTQLNEAVPEKLRGTYAGIASESAIKHLTDLGVTAVELLPVHHHLDDRHLAEKGLSNYWGYNTLAFFAPQLSYDSPSNTLGPVQEFKMMVRALHAAGIEVPVSATPRKPGKPARSTQTDDKDSALLAAFQQALASVAHPTGAP